MNTELDVTVALDEGGQKFTLTIVSPSNILPNALEIDYSLGNDISIVSVFNTIEDFEYSDDNSIANKVDLPFSEMNRAGVRENHIYIISVVHHANDKKRKRKVLTMNKNGVEVNTLLSA